MDSTESIWKSTEESLAINLWSYKNGEQMGTFHIVSDIQNILPWKEKPNKFWKVQTKPAT